MLKHLHETELGVWRGASWWPSSKKTNARDLDAPAQERELPHRRTGNTLGLGLLGRGGGIHRNLPSERGQFIVFSSSLHCAKQPPAPIKKKGGTKACQNELRVNQCIGPADKKICPQLIFPVCCVMLAGVNSRGEGGEGDKMKKVNLWIH